jgi:hypothetical protein
VKIEVFPSESTRCRLFSLPIQEWGKSAAGDLYCKVNKDYCIRFNSSGVSVAPLSDEGDVYVNHIHDEFTIRVTP